MRGDPPCRYWLPAIGYCESDVVARTHHSIHPTHFSAVCSCLKSLYPAYTAAFKNRLLRLHTQSLRYYCFSVAAPCDTQRLIRAYQSRANNPRKPQQKHTMTARSRSPGFGDVTSINLNRLLSRLDRIVLVDPSPELRKSSYERARVSAVSWCTNVATVPC